NDAQKTMGIIAALLVGAGYLELQDNGDLPVPLWVVLAAHAAIALGTLSGGWRIVKTLGQRITALKPVGGFSAETAAASALYLATFLGIPVSTTQTITGAIVGVGATRRLSAVRWGVAGRIVWAWVLTIPAAALIAAVTYAITVSPFAVAALVLAAAAVVAAVVAAGRRASRQGIEAGRDAEPAEPVEPAER
ncbi:MAG TPA: inorganic phosphate transporter, partial [Actinomycetota bacterium]|nr:inorganic phosphate transporter [Actinomycetota bacterium]